MEEKEKTIQRLKMEVVGLSNKGEKKYSFVKFKEILVVLDKILDFQIYPCDNIGLGYEKKEKYEDDTWTLEACPSISIASSHAPAHDKNNFGISKMK